MIKSQLTLLKYLAAGVTLKEIAKKLSISYNTVKTRTKFLYKKFLVNKRSDLIAKAIMLKIISTKDVKTKFQKRFYNKITDYKIIDINEPLTEQEMMYFSLVINGMNTKRIIKEMSLSSVYHARYIQNSICYKLNAVNITQAVTIAWCHGII